MKLLGKPIVRTGKTRLTAVYRFFIYNSPKVPGPQFVSIAGDAF